MIDISLSQRLSSVLSLVDKEVIAFKNFITNKNLNIKSGLRVILNGPDWNRDGIGAILRLQDDNNEGSAARIVSAGSGYWSQSSPVQILARKNTHSRIQILWPGGTKQTQRITNHQSEVQISYKEFK